MKKILFITNSISFGGAAKMLCFLAESFALKGYQVVVANLRATNNVTDFERILPNVEVVTIKTVGKNKHFHRLKAIKRLAHEKKSEIIIGFTAFPNFYSVVISKILRIPSIVSERGDPYHTFSSSIKDKIVKFVINQSAGAVFQTEGASSYYGKGLRRRSLIIPNPIFIQDEIPVIDFREREKTVVSVGRLDNEQKRYDVMLKSFALFSARHPEYILKLYGRGTQENEIRQWSQELGIQEKVKFMGLTTHPMLDIARDGMFLITSDYEGISNSLLEAMAVGLPCVSTDHSPGGARLLIEDHINGLLTPIGDVEAISKALCEFAENPDLAKKCGNNAKNVVSRFAPSKIIDMWESYINRICGDTNEY